MNCSCNNKLSKTYNNKITPSIFHILSLYHRPNTHSNSLNKINSPFSMRLLPLMCSTHGSEKKMQPWLSMSKTLRIDKVCLLSPKKVPGKNLTPIWKRKTNKSKISANKTNDFTRKSTKSSSTTILFHHQPILTKTTPHSSTPFTPTSDFSIIFFYLLPYCNKFFCPTYLPFKL